MTMPRNSITSHPVTEIMNSSEEASTTQSRFDPYSTNEVNIIPRDAKHSGVYEPQRRVEKEETKTPHEERTTARLQTIKKPQETPVVNTVIATHNIITRNTSHQTEYFQEYSTNKYRVRDAVRSANEPLPPSPYGNHTMCYAFHVKGMCNHSCKNSGDHRTHTFQEDQELLHWCLKNVKFRPDLTLEKPV